MQIDDVIKTFFFQFVGYLTQRISQNMQFVNIGIRLQNRNKLFFCEIVYFSTFNLLLQTAYYRGCKYNITNWTETDY